MSFSYKFRAPISGNSYDSKTQPEMSADRNENTGEAATGLIEGSEENSRSFSPELVELVDEKIKASLEPPHAQSTAPAEMMYRLIQSNSAKEATTASSRWLRHQYESCYSKVPGFSRFPT